MSKTTKAEFGSSIAAAKRETELAQDRSQELREIVIPRLEKERDELAAVASRIEPILRDLPEGNAQLLESCTFSDGGERRDCARGSVVTTDADLASTGRALLISAATLESLREEGLVR